MRTRTKGAALAIVAATTWPICAHAQLAPPPPMAAPPPGTTWGTPPPAPAPSPWAPGAPYGQASPYAQPYSATQQQLNASDNARSFRGLEVAYAKADVGGEYNGLGSSLNGPAFAVGAGARLI